MATTAHAPRPTRGERTRAALLAAAETVFAEKGYAAARLEDVAERVGIRRASIVYHFRDKHELYEAVLAAVFGELHDRYRAVLDGDAPLPERLQRIVDRWVRYVGERPAVARLLLWEAACAAPSATAARHIAPLIETVRAAILDGQRRGVFRAIDPIHFIFSVVGATVFFATAPPALVPEWSPEPPDAERLAGFRDEVGRIARRLLGVRSPIARRAGHSAAAPARRPQPWT